jgi:hypothetical protein
VVISYFAIGLTAVALQSQDFHSGVNPSMNQAFHTYADTSVCSRFVPRICKCGSTERCYWVSGTPALHYASPSFGFLSESWITELRFLVVFLPKPPFSCFSWLQSLLYKLHSCENAITWTEKQIVHLRLSSGLVEVFAHLGCYAVYQTRRVETSSVPLRNPELCRRALFYCFVVSN